MSQLPGGGLILNEDCNHFAARTLSRGDNVIEVHNQTEVPVSITWVEIALTDVRG